MRRSKDATEIDVRSDGILPIKDGDIIRIYSKFVKPGQPIFWQFTFRDPYATEPAQEFQSPTVLEYSLSQERLFRLTSHQYREEIKLAYLKEGEKEFEKLQQSLREKNPLLYQKLKTAQIQKHSEG